MPYIDPTGANPGWSDEPQPDFGLTEFSEVTPAVEVSILSVREFRSRLSVAEQSLIRDKAMADMEVGLVYDDFQSAQCIDVRHPAVEAGLALFVQKGLISSERKAELLEPYIVHSLGELLARQP